MIIHAEVRNKEGELEWEQTLDTEKQGKPAPPEQVLVKVACNTALAEVIDWQGRTLTISVG